jgi:hypothetical protein
MDVHSFRHFSRTYSAVFYPLFSLQSRVRCAVFDDDFWCSKVLARIHMSKREYLPLHQLLVQRSCLMVSGADNCSDSTSMVTDKFGERAM